MIGHEYRATCSRLSGTPQACSGFSTTATSEHPYSTLCTVSCLTVQPDVQVQTGASLQNTPMPAAQEAAERADSPAAEQPSGNAQQVSPGLRPPSPFPPPSTMTTRSMHPRGITAAHACGPLPHCVNAYSRHRHDI